MMATMVKLQTMIIVVLSVVVLALAVILFMVYERSATLTASSPAKTIAPTPMRPTPPPSPELDYYLQKAPRDQAALWAEQKAQKDKMERLRDLQARFKELSAGGKPPDIDELDRLLVELVEIQGTTVIAGVDFNVLRQNLQVARDVQALAKELEEESKKPTPDKNRILKITEEIQAIQGKLKANILVDGGATKVAPLPPAANAQKDRKGP
jgi:hypothetical protein